MNQQEWLDGWKRAAELLHSGEVYEAGVFAVSLARTPGRQLLENCPEIAEFVPIVYLVTSARCVARGDTVESNGSRRCMHKKHIDPETLSDQQRRLYDWAFQEAKEKVIGDHRLCTACRDQDEGRKSMYEHTHRTG